MERLKESLSQSFVTAAKSGELAVALAQVHGKPCAGEASSTALEVAVDTAKRTRTRPVKDGHGRTITPETGIRIGIRNNYRLIRTLESGTTSDVWVAKEKGSGMQVAIKVLRRDGNAEETAQRKERWEAKIRTSRFFSESQQGQDPASITSWISPQDRFVRMLDYSRNAEGRPGPETDGKWYAAYEWAEATLVERIDYYRDCRTYMGLALIRTLSKALAEILAWLQSCGLCHLHLRPESLMFCRGNWKLKDAELCRSSGPARLEPELFDYNVASPEVANVVVTQQRSSTDPARTIILNRAADAYAVGLILLEATAIRDPFEGIRKPEWSSEEWLLYMAESPPEASQLLPPSEGPAADPGLRAFLTGLLQPVAARRLTVERMLMHPFIQAVGSEKAAMPMDAGVTSPNETNLFRFRRHHFLRNACGRLPTLPFEVPALPHGDRAFGSDVNAAFAVTSALAAPDTLNTHPTITAAAAVTQGCLALTDFEHTRVVDRLPEPSAVLVPRSPRPRLIESVRLGNASSGARLSASLPSLPQLVSRVENVLRPLTPHDNPALDIKPWRAHVEAENEILIIRSKRNVRLYGEKMLKEQKKKEALEAAANRTKGPTLPPEEKEKTEAKAKAKGKAKAKAK